jgi:hypothetical protein
MYSLSVNRYLKFSGVNLHEGLYYVLGNRIRNKFYIKQYFTIPKRQYSLCAFLGFFFMLNL